MGKHSATTSKLAIGALLFTALGFVLSQAAQPIIQKQTEAMTSKAQTRVNESVEEFSVFYARELSWPTTLCTAATVTSVEGLTVDDALAPYEFDTHDALESRRVIIWGEGVLQVLLSANNSQDTFTIVDVKPEVFKHEPILVEWIASDWQGDCGDAYQRKFGLELAEGQGKITDYGVSDFGDQEDPRVKSQTLSSRTWTVSQDDVTELTIYARPDDGYYEFGITITYVLNGVEFERTIGSRDEPYKIVGWPESPERSYLLNDGSGGA